MKTLRQAPGPKGLEVLKVFALMRKNYLDGYQYLFEKYGDVVCIEQPVRRYMFFHPDHVRYILKERADNFVKGLAFDELAPVLGKGLLTSEGELWKKQRPLIVPEFRPIHLKKYSQIMIDTTMKTVDLWQHRAKTEQIRDIVPDITELTLKITCETLFGSSVREKSQQVTDALHVILEHFTRRIFAPLRAPFWFPTPGNVRTRNAIKKIDEVVFDIIEMRRKERREGKEGDFNVLSRLLEAHEKTTGESMSAQQLRDEVITLFLAGHETTSNALCWTFYLLAQHPEVVEKIREEADVVLSGEGISDFKDIARLSYARMAIEESMRLYPPATLISRLAVEDDEIDGYAIAKNSFVDVSQFITHRHPAIWDRANEFIPERFAQERVANIDDCSYFPFGIGPRICIGKHFTLMMTTVSLAILCERFDLKLAPGFQVVPHPAITLRLKTGLGMSIKSRSISSKAHSVKKLTPALVRTVESALSTATK